MTIVMTSTESQSVRLLGFVREHVDAGILAGFSDGFAACIVCAVPGMLCPAWPTSTQ